jgi:hypothetical protein
MSENISHKINECDQLRSPERVCEPDSRTHFFVVLEDNGTGKFRRRVIEDQYEAIDCFKLNEAVPDSVAIHFETAKNLYLYAWFVYRFYPVSEQHVLATLEFALRERFPNFVKEQSGKRGFGLWKLLKYAIENGYLKNELFTTREIWAWRRAEIRHSFEMSQKMMACGLDQIEYSDSDVVVTQEDLDSDWLGTFQDAIPDIRNRHAHGSGDLMPSVRHSFEMVTELINQLYSN